MPVIDSMMWRFSTLFNYIRGGVRSGAWRVRETPSQLLSDDREDRDEQRSEEAAAGPRPRGRRAGPPPPPPPPPVRAAAPLAPQRPVTRAPASPGGPCAPSGPLSGGLPSPTATHLPPTAALWYLGLAGQSADGSTAATTVLTATKAGGTRSVPGSSSGSGTVPTTDRGVKHTAVASTVPATATATGSVLIHNGSGTGGVTAPATAPAEAAPAAGSVRASVPSNPVTAPPTPTSAPETPETAPGADCDPADPLSALRVSFASEHDRLMARLQLAAGAGVAVSRPRQALECFRAAAALGSAPAWFNCGLCFQEGRGTDVDLEKAAVCYEEASRLGHAAAGYNLALLAAAGRLVTSPQCEYDVTGLLERAAAAGSEEAAEFLERWRLWSEETETDEESDCLSLSPPGRSVSLPALTAGCSPGGAAEPDPDLWPAQLGAGRQAVLFYLQESP